MEYFDFGTVFFLVAAVVIFWQLRNVLGRRTGNEKPPRDPYSSARNAEAKPTEREDEREDNVIALPRRQEMRSAGPDFTDIDAIAPAGSAVNEGMRALRKADASFRPAKFIDGVKSAYEMIVTAFAEGDRTMLQRLLSKDVYEGFVAAIDEREKSGESLKSTFVGIETAEITDAAVKGNEAHITLRLVSQMISATYDKDGKVVDGDPEEIVANRDVWTFARDLRTQDPNWKLVSTEAE